jgi:hypothetical protein
MKLWINKMRNEKKEENSLNFDQAKTNFKLGIEKIEKKNMKKLKFISDYL